MIKLDKRIILKDISIFNNIRIYIFKRDKNLI